jgi:hypothetical protein
MGALMGSACLRDRAPAAGRHLLLDREVTSITFSREGTAPAGSAVVYFDRQSSPTGPDASPVIQPATLMVLPASGGEPRALVSGVEYGGRFPDWDGHGRMLLVSPPAGAAEPELLRVDPTSGQVEDLGEGTAIAQVGEWLLLTRSTADGSLGSVARRDDGTVVQLGAGTLIEIIDEVFYVLRETSVHAIAVDGGDTTLVTDVGIQAVLSSATGPKLFFSRPSTNGAFRYDLFLRDVSTGDERVLASDVERFESGPQNGALLSLTTTTDGMTSLHVVSVVDASHDRTAELPSADPNDPGTGYYQMAWRPGTDELWAFDPARPITVVSKPGEPALEVERMAATNIAAVPGGALGGVIEPQQPLSGAAPFIGGGAHWLSFGQDGLVHLGNADDPGGPEGPPFALSGGTIARIVSVAPDSYVVHLAVSNDRNDLYWASPAKNVTRLLAERVGDVVYGTDRVLALSQPQTDYQSLDVTLFELPAGTSTRLAQNVAGLALAPCAGCSPIDRGTAVVYAVHAPTPYPYDGVWVGELP